MKVRIHFLYHCFLLLAFVGMGLPCLGQYYITTIAGNGAPAYYGDSFQATIGALHNPSGVAIDTAYNVYIADFSNQTIRKVTAGSDTGGKIYTIAGIGDTSGITDNVLATLAKFNGPIAVLLDATNQIYVSDNSNNEIRKFTEGSIINKIAGTGVVGHTGDGAIALNATLNAPYSIAISTNTVNAGIYIADRGNNCIRKIDNAGIITTFAGGGTNATVGYTGPATSAKLNNPQGIACDSKGNVYIADASNNCIRKVDPFGTISTIYSIILNNPNALAIDKYDNLYVSDCNNNCIRKINFTKGVIYPIVGNTTSGSSGDGSLAIIAEIRNPIGITVSPDTNIVYIADKSNHKIRMAISALPNNHLPLTTICTGQTMHLTNPIPGGTWASSNPTAGTIDALGNFTTISAGTTIISYSLQSIAALPPATNTVTVVAPPTPIIGPTTICVGNPIILIDDTTIGNWSISGSSSVSATTLSPGNSYKITGTNTVTATITYTNAPSCNTTLAITFVTTTPAPIIGSDVLCMGSSITMTDDSSGTWSCSGNAAITTSGAVTGISQGSATIIFTSNCGSIAVTKTITVNNPPTPISSSSANNIICIGSTLTLTDAIPNGNWSSSDATIAMVSGTGIVTGLADGLAIITYTNGCGTQTISINVGDAPAPITGPRYICVGTSITLNDATPGGNWTSLDAITTINPITGVVTGISDGISTILYTTPTCGASTTYSVYVNTNVSAGTISGSPIICIHSPTSFTVTDTTTGTPNWSMANTNATIATNGVVTGITQGTDIISYTITNGCGTATATLSITIVPQPAAPAITTIPLYIDSLCSFSWYQNFGATNSLPAGETYYWSTNNQNAQIYRKGSIDSQYCLVNFMGVGDDTISLVVIDASTNAKCQSLPATKIIHVHSGDTTDFGKHTIAYDNDQQQFICFSSNGNEVKYTYQWGYDMINSLQPIILTAETHQNYFCANCMDSTDFYSYWVQITKDGCTQKIYVDTPLRNKGLPPTTPIITNPILVFPNPSTGIFTIQYPYATITVIKIYDLAGRQVYEKTDATLVSSASLTTKLNTGNYILYTTIGNKVYHQLISVLQE